MIEPESIIEINVFVVSHHEWEGLLENKQETLIMNEVKKQGLI